MQRRVEPLGDERGIALILGLMVLLTLCGLALAFLAVSALEPRISRNLHDASRARWLAEAGIELGYGLLAAADAGDGTWSTLLATATADAPWIVLPSLDGSAPPGLTSVEGTYTVSVRTNLEGGGVIVRSVGTFNTSTRMVEVVVRRVVAEPASTSTPDGLHSISGWREF